MKRRFLAALIGAVSLLAITDIGQAAPKKPPSDPDCLKWALYEVKGNWAGAPNGMYWICVQGANRGMRVAATADGVSGSGGGGGNGNNGDDAGNKPGWGTGTTGHTCPPGQEKKDDGKSCPPGQAK